MVLNEHDKSNRHTRKARHQPHDDRAARHANPLACGRLRQMTWKDKDELKTVVERLKMVNVH